MSEQELVDKMTRVWRSIAELCSNLTEPEWKTPTDCPGWSVQDQLSHLAGSESWLLGRQTPDHTPTDLSHVKNEGGKRNEMVVDWRRSWPGAKVLEEFQEVTSERLGVLRAMSTDDFAAETQTPIGPGTVRDLIQIRIFDAWVHEQDIRRALKRPGDLDGPIAEHSMGRCVLALPFVVGKKAQAADGTIAVFDVTGAAGRTLALGVEGKRAKLLDSAPATPTVRLTMDVETFACLGCGRWDPSKTLEAGKVGIDGDRALGEAIVAHMSFMI